MVPGLAAVVFDVEGTLVDCVPQVLESWRETLHEAGHAFSLCDLQPLSGLEGAWMLERLLPQESQETRQKLLEEQGRRYRAEFLRLARPFAGVRPLIEGLKGWGVAIGVATTCKMDQFASYDEHLRIRPFVDAVVCGDAVEHGKPDPALFHTCLSELGLKDPAMVIGVGDTPFDAMAACAAGLRCAGVLTGGFQTNRFGRLGANTYSIKSAIRSDLAKRTHPVAKTAARLSTVLRIARACHACLAQAHARQLCNCAFILLP